MKLEVPVGTQELQDFMEWCVNRTPIVYRGKDYYVISVSIRSDKALAKVELVDA